MKTLLLRGAATLFLGVAASAAQAGPIGQACMANGRAAGNAALCGCVQQVADATLNGADQRLAAKFFADPDQAEKVRMKASASANAFWDRYTAFGQQAELACQG